MLQKINERKLNSLIDATVNDINKAEIAILRQANDQYRKIIFNAEVYANTGAGTYEKAVDMATKDFLAAGLNCVEYKNGSRHTLADYAEMVIRTASKRAYLQGEGEKRQEWGISTVIINKRGNPCPKCLPFVGKVMIDDVWSGGKASDGPYMLMSDAIAKGLYHPRCKDGHTTYFPGISSEGAEYTEEEKRQVVDRYNAEQKENYAKRQAEKFGRLAKYSLDEENKRRYEARAEEWKERIEKNSKDDIEGADSGSVRSNAQKMNIDAPRIKNKTIRKAQDDFDTVLTSSSGSEMMVNRMIMASDTVDYVEDNNLKSAFSYIPDKDVIKYNSNAKNFELYDLNYVQAHELSHRIDMKEIQSWNNQQFASAIEYSRQIVSDNREVIIKWFEDGGKYVNDVAMSDIISALSNGDLNDYLIAGHDVEYWQKDSKNISLEVFANIASIDIVDYDSKIELKTMFKELFDAYRGMVE